MKRVRCDVLVVGGGGAGLMSAYFAAKNDARVIVVNKGRVQRTGATIMAPGAISAVDDRWKQEGDSRTIHFEVTVRAMNAKTRVSRTLPISRITAESIGRLLEGRPEEWGDLCPVFANWEGTPLRVNSWGMKLNKKYSRQLKTKIRPYDLRHVFAMNFLRNEGNIFALQRIMGHTSLDMTRRYLAFSKGDLKENHGKASPVNNLMPKRSRATKL